MRRLGFNHLFCLRADPDRNIFNLAYSFVICYSSKNVDRKGNSKNIMMLRSIGFDLESWG